MKYIPVLGAAPSISTKTPVMHHFDDYLISIAEPTTSRGWTLHDVYKQVKKIIKRKLPEMNLYLDSGGYQIIIGHITENRITEYIDVYHFIIENFLEEIDFIFSLDINTPKFNKEKLISYNDYSIDQSIGLIKKHPILKDKQLFIVQSRFPHILKDWLELMDKHSVFLYYDRYSFGGLVGMKSATNVQFNHFVPMTIWLLTYIKNRTGQKNIASTPKQIHMLGQSSRVAIITSIILEKLFDIEITMDSSEVIRFSPIAAKIPMVHENENDFQVVNNLEEMTSMVEAHSDPKAHQEIEKMKDEIRGGRVTNQTFVELICQNIANLTNFGEHLVEKVPPEELINWSKEDFQDFHSLFQIGRLATEMANNMRLIKILKPYFDDNNFNGIHEHTLKIIQNYYSDTPSKTGELHE